MTPSDAKTIGTLAAMAALADGTLSPDERRQLDAAAARLGLPDMGSLVAEAAGTRVRELAGTLLDSHARVAAYAAALAVCNADGSLNVREQQFLSELRAALGLSPDEVASAEREAAAAVVPVASLVAPDAAAAPGSDAALDEVILQQAMLTGALELLPEGLANMAILPLQLRLVYQVGQRHGQQLDARQVADLAGTFGIGVAAQAVEGVVRKLLGGLAGGLLGGLVGGAAGVAGGAAVTFAATYALGHAANTYYAQGRSLSADDLRALYGRFQGEARELLPRVQGQIEQLSRRVRLPDVLSQLRMP